MKTFEPPAMSALSLATTVTDPSVQPKFALRTYSELLALPPPEWLVDGLIEIGTLTVLYGPPGSGKSFLALDWALSIATGQQWFGRNVKAGPVVYVVGEGGAGIVRRIRAWTTQHKGNNLHDSNAVLFLMQAPAIGLPSDVQELVAAFKQKGITPSLIVLDTLARCFGAADENSARDMGLFVRGCQELQATTGATLLVVHHSGKQKSKNNIPTERGSSALRAAADVVIAQTKNADIVTVANEKQKDEEAFKSITLLLKRVELEKDPGTQRAITSCVLLNTASAVGGSTSKMQSAEQPVVNDSEKLALQALVPLNEATSGEWAGAISALKNKEVSSKTFDNWRAALVEVGLVELVPGKLHTYRPTALGKAFANGAPYSVAA